MLNREEIQKRLKQRREASGLRQDSCAKHRLTPEQLELLGDTRITQSDVAHWETDRTTREQVWYALIGMSFREDDAQSIVPPGVQVKDAKSMGEIIRSLAMMEAEGIPLNVTADFLSSIRTRLARPPALPVREEVLPNWASGLPIEELDESMSCLEKMLAGLDVGTVAYNAHIPVATLIRKLIESRRRELKQGRASNAAEASLRGGKVHEK